VFLGSDDSFVLEHGMSAKVHKQAEFESRGLQIIVHLCTKHIFQIRNGFDLHDDLSKAHEISLICQIEDLALIVEYQLRLRDRRDASQLEFNRQALLIDRLQESTPLLLIDLKQAPMTAKLSCSNSNAM
jgi:hypothetical protein